MKNLTFGELRGEREPDFKNSEKPRKLQQSSAIRLNLPQKYLPSMQEFTSNVVRNTYLACKNLFTSNVVRNTYLACKNLFT